MKHNDLELRALYPSEVEDFAARRGVRKIAVENFLMTVHNNEWKDVAIANLNLDTRLYNWNAATVKAIREGIDRAVKRPVQKVKNKTTKKEPTMKQCMALEELYKDGVIPQTVYEEALLKVEGE